ncbi:hypothetical protein SAMN05660429_00324 [Thalassotalea agarivorans]|uniref:Uncharacterized protein n=1 Tax=Thalassotalea agarivorans TaxID=349064 RepID=A0A1H9YRS9_THASX|nr:hypothetical protein SAMN05660429_00324 [Thalassotalea agarivorans]
MPAFVRKVNRFKGFVTLRDVKNKLSTETLARIVPDCFNNVVYFFSNFCKTLLEKPLVLHR